MWTEDGAFDVQGKRCEVSSSTSATWRAMASARPPRARSRRLELVVKVWPDASGQTAAALQAGESPPALEVFLFESMAKPVEKKEEDSAHDD